MERDGIWLYDPDTKEPRLIYYDELDTELQNLFPKPIGGFCYEASNFLRLPLPPTPYYLKDWLPRQGKAMLYAPAKAGKSTLSIQLARCIASGIPFLGIPTTTATVLYVQFELGEEILQDRLRKTKQSYTNVYLGTTFSMKLDRQGGQDYLRQALDAIQPQVLILDPLYKTLTGEENASTDMRIVCDFIDSIIEAYKISVWLLHHTGKDQTKGGRGSSIFEDWVDSYLEMKRTSARGEPLRCRITPKLLRHAELPPNSINITLDGGEFVCNDAPLTVEDHILLYAQKVPHPITPKEVLDEGIGSNTSVFKAFSKLVTTGKLRKLERGQYEPTINFIEEVEDE